MKITLLTITVLLLLCIPGCAQDTKPSEDKTDSKKRLLTVPYPFFNDTIGSGLGVAATRRVSRSFRPPAKSASGTVYGCRQGH